MLNNTRKKIGKVWLTLVAVLTLGAVAIAQQPVEQKVSFYLDGKVGNEVVEKGTYTVVIPESDQGAFEIKVGKKTITAQFTKRQNQGEAEADKMTYRDNGDGTRTIATITPRGRKFTLLLQENSNVAGK